MRDFLKYIGYFILTAAKICNHIISMYPQMETTILTEFTLKTLDIVQLHLGLFNGDHV